MLKLATLGPSGTNHELVARRYLAKIGVTRFEIVLVGDFADAADRLKAGAVDAVLQCAVHPATPATLGENFRSFHAVDCFIADSQPLAILTRKDVAEPRSIGLLSPSNDGYADLSRWEARRNVASLPHVFDLLLAGEIDSGLTYARYAEERPDVLRIDELLGSPDDVWIVYCRERVAEPGGILGSEDAPGGALLRALSESSDGEKP